MCKTSIFHPFNLVVCKNPGSKKRFSGVITKRKKKDITKPSQCHEKARFIDKKLLETLFMNLTEHVGFLDP